MIRDQCSVFSSSTHAHAPIFAESATRRIPGQPQRLVRRIIASLGLLAAVPAIVAQASAASQRSVVVLDVAHGGTDNGAALGGQPEKNYTLTLSVRLRSLLSARGFQVVTTRESDTAVEPDSRVEIADRAGALACLSLHATSVGSGVHIFVSSLSPVGQGRLEPWKTAQAAWVSQSLALAGVLNSALSHANIGVTLGRVDLPVIDGMTCPAVAVEIAPQRTENAPGGESLSDPTVQAGVADALAAALVEWRSVERGAHEP